MTPERVRVATRGSILALRQSDWVADRLRAAWPGIDVELVAANTAGDRDKQTPLASLGAGVFVKGVEELLLGGAADLAVHSLKDVPSTITPALELVAFPVREDPRDGLICRVGHNVGQLPHGARLATGSPRRKAQLLAMRPDLEVVPVRGNLDTRIRKLREGQFEALVVAVAGLARLGRLDELSQRFEADVCTPAVGQGTLVVQCRVGDEEVRRVTAAIDEPACRVESLAERAFLAALGGGCQLPAGALARARAECLEIVGVVASADGREVARERLVGPADDPERVGRQLAERLKPRASRLMAVVTAGS